MSHSVEGKRVALIGGAGFIGHHLALELQQRGAAVHILDSLQVNNLVSITANTHGVADRDLYLHLINERLELIQRRDIPLHVLDARDYHSLSHQLNLIRPDVIVHLAAVAHAGRANKNPYTTFDHSSRTLENALDCARSHDVGHFVYFSSSMVYGNFPAESVTEDTHCEPLGIYGALKFGGEKLVIAYNQVFDLPYTIIRPSALYGERCISRRVIQIFVERALRGESITVEGDGSDRLDFTYIDDLVSGVVKVISHPESRGEILNLTHGEARSIKEVVDLLREEFPDLEVEYGEPDRLMPERGTLSVDKARDLIGYAPSFPLEVGLPKYVAWYRDLKGREPQLFKPVEDG